MASADKKSCACCGKLKGTGDYYGSNSPFHKQTKQLHVCKQCVWDQVGDNVQNITLVKDVLRMIDKPFINDLWNASVDEGNNTNKNIFKTYMKNLGMRQNRELTWADSDKEISTSPMLPNEDDESDLEQVEITAEVKRKWGINLTPSDYEFLETFYTEYSHNYATDTPVQRNLYRNIAKVHWQAEKELSAGNIKVYKDLMELSSKLHNDGNIKPIQSTGANDDKGLSSYGLWIKTIEQDEPCEYFENKPLYEDYDGFKKYIDKWFLRPMKNIFNLQRDFDVRDDD